MAVKQLEMIAYALRDIALSRRTDSDIMNHVSVKLPAPVFDQLIMDLQRELPATTADFDYGMTRTSNHFKFAGVRFDRVDGKSWSVSDRHIA